MITLEALGWNRALAAAFAEIGAPDLVPARVIEHRGVYRVATGEAELAAVATGKLRHRAEAAAALPAVGDWVAIRPAAGTDRAAIHAIFPRRTVLSRKVAGHRQREQVLAANVDTVFVMMGLDADYSPRRLERYLTLTGASGARPVVLLTKNDLCPDPAARLAESRAVAGGVPVEALNLVGTDVQPHLEPHLRGGETIVLLGSSGVGKSTLLNSLLEREVQRTGEVRASDSRGRHTTTHRQLFRLPGGALVIDTPGLRELQLWEAAEGMEIAFAEIEALAANCRFRNCRHADEPGCAVREALTKGALDAARFQNFQRLRQEARPRGHGRR